MRGTIAIATSIISITGHIYRPYLAHLSLLIDPIFKNQQKTKQRIRDRGVSSDTLDLRQHFCFSVANSTLVLFLE